jgi:hypothetical protein
MAQFQELLALHKSQLVVDVCGPFLQVLLHSVICSSVAVAVVAVRASLPPIQISVEVVVEPEVRS